MGKLQRDPASVELDHWARRLLDRAYARPGQWVGTRLANPPPGLSGQLGADLLGPDDKSGAGRLNARTRWGRAAVRALYYQHKWFSGAPGGDGWRPGRRNVGRGDLSLVVEVGRSLPGGQQAGSLLRPGRAVRVKVTRGGRAHVRSSSDVSYTLDGRGQSRPGERDWQG